MSIHHLMLGKSGKRWLLGKGWFDLSCKWSICWVNLFLDKNINKQVILFDRTILNIFHNFIQSKLILCDDRDPPWINGRIKYLIKKKKKSFQKQKESNIFNHLYLELSNVISFSISKCHERLAVKLNRS